jgi:hypothetical protein
MVGIVQKQLLPNTAFSKKKVISLVNSIFNESKDLVSQDTVVESIKAILSHEFIDCGYRF